jgi:DNA-binding LacI/PurR family transcriptional regulator
MQFHTLLRRGSRLGRLQAKGNRVKHNIRDVAQRPPSSTATVLRVLNGVRCVKLQTAANVRPLAEELRCHPSSRVPALASKSSAVLGLIISDIANPFFPELWKSFQISSVNAGYEVLIAHTNYRPERLAVSVRQMIEQQVDGLAIMTSEVAPRLMDEWPRTRLPMVFLDVGKRRSLISNISVDYTKGIREAVQHVVALGHERIGFISGPLTLKSARSRRSAFLTCVAECGIVQNAVVIAGNHQVSGGYRTMTSMLSLAPRTTAVLCSNDLTAIGALHAMNFHGFQVPDDISLVGFDDIALSEYTQPSLTTIRLSRVELGQRAFEALVRNLDGHGTNGAEIRIGTSLVVRHSTGAVNRTAYNRRPGRSSLLH